MSLNPRFALLMIVTAVGLATACAAEGDVWERIDRELVRSLASENLPGFSVAVVQDGAVIFAKGYGWANVEKQVPVTPQTVFPIGSIEKEMTAAAVLRLSEADRLSLDASVATFLPDLDTEGYDVTIRQMLQQVSGLRGFDAAERWRRENGLAAVDGAKLAPNAAGLDAGDGFDAADMVGLFNGVPLYHPPGERWIYSQPNFDLMCLVIAAASGRTYYQEMADVLEQAGVAYHPDWTPPPDRAHPTTAQGYESADSGLEPYWEENFGSGWMSATGLAVWGQALAAGNVISPESYQLMTTPARLSDGRSWPYGMGVGLSSYAGNAMVEHTGNVGGFTSSLTYYPGRDLSLAVVANLGYTLSVVAIKQRLSRMLLGIPEPVWKDVPVGERDRDRFVGRYDAGTFGFEVLETESGLAFTFGAPFDGEDPPVYVASELMYQGGGYFVGAAEPEAIWVWFDRDGAPPGEIMATIDGPGWPLQGRRIASERE